LTGRGCVPVWGVVCGDSGRGVTVCGCRAM
jgi:hypothetical protein